jgi:uncharacterized membrane protein YhiD involved in acid resistance
VLDSILSGGITAGALLICLATALLLGLGAGAIHMFRNHYSKSFVVTLVLLPAIVALVIMMVNGNIGAGVAVAGTFSLVRFRSVPGDAREICSIFFTMALGLVLGMGYIAFAVLFFLVIGAAMLLLSVLQFGEQKSDLRELKITIPENLDYNGLFDDVFSKYTSQAQLVRVKTSNLGTLYELQYDVQLNTRKSARNLSTSSAAETATSTSSAAGSRPVKRFKEHLMKRKPQKIISAVLALSLAAFMLSGCSQSGTRSLPVSRSFRLRRGHIIRRYCLPGRHPGSGAGAAQLRCRSGRHLDEHDGHRI